MARLNDLSAKEWIQFTKSWFRVSAKARSKDSIKHPAKYPEELVEPFVNFFTKKGDSVFDPFLGVGSTVIAAENLERVGYGIELNKDFFETAQANIKNKSNVFNGDVRNELKRIKNDSIDFVMTSPPYWNILSKKRGNSDSQHGDRQKKGLNLIYSNDSNDLSNIDDYDAFLNELRKIFNQIWRKVKDDKYMVVVIQNFRNVDGNYMTLAWDLVGKLSKKWQFVGEKIWFQEDKKLGIWGYPSIFVPNIHHHYCLIFRKKHE